MVAIFERPVLTLLLSSLLCRALGSLLKLYTSLSSFHISELSQAPLPRLLPLSSLLFHSSSDQITSANCAVYTLLPEILGLYQITRSPEYLKDGAHHFCSQKEKKNTFKEWFFDLMCFTDTLKGSFPTKICFSSVEVCLLDMKRNWFSCFKLVCRSRPWYSYSAFEQTSFNGSITRFFSNTNTFGI